MEKQEFKYVNEIFLRGPIVKKFANDIACNFTIKTQRLNLPNIKADKEVVYNYPELSFYGNLKNFAADNYFVGDVVEIVGLVKPLKKVSKETGKDYYDQKLIGVYIEPAERLLMREFGYEEGAFLETENLVRLGGIISKITSPHSGVLSINIRTYIGGRVNNIQTFLYERNVEKYMEHFKTGDEVFAVGTIQTLKKKLSDGSGKYFRNIVISAICRANTYGNV